MIARVVATKLKSTVTVLVEGKKIHPLYKKAFLRSKKFLVHDPIGVAMGDMVEIVKVAPISKRKHFRIVKVLGKSLEEITEAKLKEHAKGVIEEIMPEEKESKGETVADEKSNEKGGKTEAVVVDDLAEDTKSQPKKRTKSVQNK